MTKNFWIATIAAFVLLMGLGVVVHGVLLDTDYKSLPAMFRTADDQAGYLPFMLLAHLITAMAIAWLYGKTDLAGPFLERGAKFGLALAAVMIIPKFLIYYAVQPMPPEVVAKQIIFDTVALVLIGIVVARLGPSRVGAR